MLAFDGAILLHPLERQNELSSYSRKNKGGEVKGG